MSLQVYEKLLEAYKEVRARGLELETERDFHSELSALTNNASGVYQSKARQILDDMSELEKQIKGTIGGDA